MKHVIASLKTTTALLNKYQLAAKRKYGQNFIIDEATIDNIVELAKVDNDSICIEIGPGLGALTQKLALKAFKVIAFEIDKDMVNVLHQELSEFTNLEIVNQDFLEVDLNDFRQKYQNSEKHFTIISNLPYYITSEIMIKLCNLDLSGTSLVVMMQKEVADRIIKTNGGKEENMLTLLSKYYYDVKLGLDVQRSSFIPEPNVDSAVLVYTHKDVRELDKEEEKILVELIRVLFSKRRKTIYNNLKDYINVENIEPVISGANLDLKIRADDLKLHDFVNLVKMISQITHQNR
jgi:16S rRNA (adenine1518-N6/adenine1519-N6)-dimethyltransferase